MHPTSIVLLVIALFVAACGNEHDGTQVVSAEQAIQKKTTLLVSVDADVLGPDEVGKILDYMVRNQETLQATWQGAEFGAPREGQWRFLVVADCEVGKAKLIGLLNKSLTRADHKDIASAIEIECAAEEAYSTVSKVLVE